MGQSGVKNSRLPGFLGNWADLSSIGNPKPKACVPNPPPAAPQAPNAVKDEIVREEQSIKNETLSKVFDNKEEKLPVDIL